jgi:hypothetical protein
MAGPIRMGWAISIKSYLNWQLACIHDPDHQFNDGSVLYQARAWIKGPEPVPILFTSMMKNRWCTVHTQLNVLSIQYLLPSPVVWIIIWTDIFVAFLPHWNSAHGQRQAQKESCTSYCLFSMFDKFWWIIHLTITVLFINKYWHVTVQYSSVICL